MGWGGDASVGPPTRASSPASIPPFLAAPTTGGVGLVVGGLLSTARWAKQAHVTGLADDALRELCVVPCFYRVSLQQ